MPHHLAGGDNQRRVDHSECLWQGRLQRRGGHVRGGVVGHEGNLTAGEVGNPIGHERRRRRVVKLNACLVWHDLGVARLIELKGGINRRFDDVRR